MEKFDGTKAQPNEPDELGNDDDVRLRDLLGAIKQPDDSDQGEPCVAIESNGSPAMSNDDLSDLFTDVPEPTEEPDNTPDVPDIPDDESDELADVQDILNEMNHEQDLDDNPDEMADVVTEPEPEPEEPDTYEAWVVDSIKRNASFWTRLLSILLIVACAGLGYMFYERGELAPVASAPVTSEPVQEQPAVTPEPEPVASEPVTPEVTPEPEPVLIVEEPAPAEVPYFIPLDIDATDARPDTLVLLPHFEPVQAPWWSSGVACAQMVLDYWNRYEGDFRALAKRVSDHGPLHPGVCLEQIVEIFTSVGGLEIESTKDYINNKDAIDLAFLKQHIRDGIPVIVGWTGAGAQWQVLIGYDEMGTDDEGDDILIMANPFDTMPSVDDGIGVYEARSFIENFKFYDFDSDINSIKERCFVAVKPN